MHVHARVPVLLKHDDGMTEAVSVRLSRDEIVVEADVELYVGAKVELRVDLVGSDVTTYVAGAITHVQLATRNRRAEFTVKSDPMSPEDAWNYAAWLAERTPIVTRRAAPAPVSVLPPAEVTFVVSEDYRDVAVSWLSSGGFRRSFQEELVHYAIRVVSRRAPPAFGAPVRVLLTLPDGRTLTVQGIAVQITDGVVVLQLELPPGESMRLRRLVGA